ncbi:MAG: hypothetical protein WBL80_06840, partial [Erysipelotrichaceae bacterium]
RDHLAEFPQLRRNSWRENASIGNVGAPKILIPRSETSTYMGTQLKDIPKVKNTAYHITDLDKNIFDGIDRPTTEVVLNTERIHKHIAIRHPEMLDKTMADVKAVIDNPDIVFKGRLDKNEITFVKHDGKHSMIVPVRLITPEELSGNPTYRNSILTYFRKSKARALKDYGT